MYSFYKQKMVRASGYADKILFIMRLTTIILITAIMQVSAASFAQKITLSEKNTPIARIFEKINSQSGYDFLVGSQMLKDAKLVNIEVTDMELKAVLEKIFSSQPLNFEIQEKMVVISRKEISIMDRLSDKISVLLQQQITLIIYLKDCKGNPLPGGSARVISTGQVDKANEQGAITGIRIAKDEKVVFSYVGYKNLEKVITAQPDIKGRSLKTITVKLEQDQVELNEVAVASKGYQDIPRERSTGSFEVITAEQLEHSSDPNLLRRLEGITTSMDFRNDLRIINSANNQVLGLAAQRRNSPLTNLTIRGKNTLNSLSSVYYKNTSGQVLVVIDGVASPYSIDKVNPNDVESMTILKDAAAASIWGSRAANGVIVIKTKRGRYDQPLSVSFNMNLNISDKPDLFYRKVMSTSDYIDAQVFQFNQSGLTIGPPDLVQPQFLYSPVAEIMQLKKDGLSDDLVNAKLDALRGNDIRNDYKKYLLRNPFTQSYSLGVDGGSKKIAYRVSAGYDKTLNNTINSGSDRWSLGYNTSIRVVKNLELNANIVYTQGGTQDQSRTNIINPTPKASSYYPYTELADNQGNPLSVPFKYRDVFKDLLAKTYGSKILDLTYKPLDDINESFIKTSSKSLNFNLNANYKFTPVVSASLVYDYNKGNDEEDNLFKQNSFFMRDLITFFTTPGGTKQIPLGALFIQGMDSRDYQSARGQINLHKDWRTKNSLNAIAGMEVTQNYMLHKPYFYYGYNEKTLTSNNQLNYTSFLTTLFNDNEGFSDALIQSYSTSSVDYMIRTMSFQTNIAYTYNNRYTLSGSARKDMSSVFGVGTNDKGTPFYHFGGSWNIANEDFYKLSWLPRLQLRATFGYNGNANPSAISKARIIYTQNPQTNGLPTAFTYNSGGATNNSLRPEKTGILNLGLDFGLKNSRISGSIEYYRKNTTDLITGSPLDPSTGAVPHEVWIYKGKIIGITSWEYVDAFNIEQVLAGKVPNWPIKNNYYQLDADGKALFTLDSVQIDTGKTAVKYAAIDNYKSVNGISKDEIATLIKIVRDLKNKKIRTYFINQPIYQAYYVSWMYAEMEKLGSRTQPMPNAPNQVVWEVVDKARYKYSYDYHKNEMYSGEWYRKNAICFESLNPDTGQTDKQIYRSIVTDLNRLLGLSVRWEKRKEKVLVLIRNTKEDKLKSKSVIIPDERIKQVGTLYQYRGNFGIPVANMMNQNADNPYVFDETNYGNSEIDMDLNVPSWTDIAAVHKAIAPYGLALKEEERLVDKFVFSEVNGGLLVDVQMQKEAKAKREAQKGMKAPTPEEGKSFIADNKKRPGIVTLPSGVQYKVIEKGNGGKPGAGEKVIIHQTAMLVNGLIFSNSKEDGNRGDPIRLDGEWERLKGLQEALKLMAVGSKWEIYVPSELAFGGASANDRIPANSAVIYQVELLGIAQ